MTGKSELLRVRGVVAGHCVETNMGRIPIDPSTDPEDIPPDGTKVSVYIRKISVAAGIHELHTKEPKYLGKEGSMTV